MAPVRVLKKRPLVPLTLDVFCGTSTFAGTYIKYTRTYVLHGVPMTPQAARTIQTARKEAVANLRAKKVDAMQPLAERRRRIDEIGSAQHQGKRFVIRREDGMITISLERAAG